MLAGHFFLCRVTEALLVIMLTSVSPLFISALLFTPFLLTVYPLFPTSPLKPDAHNNLMGNYWKSFFAFLFPPCAHAQSGAYWSV